jgi:hypothetical protein
VKGKVLFLGPGGQSPSFENDFDVFKLVFVCLGSKSLRYVFIGIYNSMYDLRSFYKRKEKLNFNIFRRNFDISENLIAVPVTLYMGQDHGDWEKMENWHVMYAVSQKLRYYM